MPESRWGSHSLVHSVPQSSSGLGWWRRQPVPESWRVGLVGRWQRGGGSRAAEGTEANGSRNELKTKATGSGPSEDQGKDGITETSPPGRNPCLARPVVIPSPPQTRQGWPVAVVGQAPDGRTGHGAPSFKVNAACPDSPGNSRPWLPGMGSPKPALHPPASWFSRLCSQGSAWGCASSEPSQSTQGGPPFCCAQGALARKSRGSPSPAHTQARDWLLLRWAGSMFGPHRRCSGFFLTLC